MPGVSRVSQDSAGGTITGVMVGSVYVNGTHIVCQGAAVQPHGDAPHDAPVMVGHSGTVYAGGIAICRAGDNASCSHSATGSGDVFSG